MTPETGGAPARMLAALAAAALPAEVVAAWNEESPAPAAGQLWRARWENFAEMVLLVSVDDSTLLAVPVTVDVDFADEQTVVVPADGTTVGVPLAVWTGLRRELPLFVLDRTLGSLQEPWSRSTDLLSTASQDREGSIGPRVVTAADHRQEYRARLTDTFDALASARWVPQGAGNLPGLLREAGLAPAVLAEVLGVGPQDALALRRGTMPVTPDQAAVLASRLNLEAADVLAANPQPPADLVTRLDQPRRRRQLASLAAQNRTDERTARLNAAYGTLQLAARQTGGPAAPAWDARLDRYFEATLDA